MTSRRKRRAGSFVYEIPREQAIFSRVRTRQPRALNALIVAEAVFEIEKALKEGPVRKAVIPIFEPDALVYPLAELRSILNELLIYVLVEDVDIQFEPVKLSVEVTGETEIQATRPNVCLFSGGVDSYSGVLVARQILGEVEAVFCAHSDQSKIIHLVRKLARTRLARFGVDVHELRVSAIRAQGYAQLRGFLYTVSCAAWIERLKADTLVVTECGPTMYQPRFAPFDIVTMTTHPIVLKHALRVIRLVLGREVKISTPFENLTKAEVMAICPDKEGLRKTHSCISQRFGSHDGTCYGCVVRRLAGIAAGVRDVAYDKNVLSDEKASSGNLFALLSYCFEILTNYRGMEDFETETIEAYGKHDLFRRFALDNFAAIHKLVLEGRTVKRSVRLIYEELKQVIGPGALDSRLLELRTGRFNPTF